MLVIRDWMTFYESAQSRSVSKLSWVRVPNSHDTQGYCRLMAQPDSMELFGAFVLIVQVASKCPERGILTDSTGTPLDAFDIAAQCRGNATVIERAIRILTDPKIGWLAECADFGEALFLSGREAPSENALQLSARYQQNASSYQQTAKNHQPRPIEKRREEKRREEEREESNFERASGRSTAIEERPPARPQGDTGTDAGATVSAGATPASEHGERVRPERALVQSVWLAMQERFPRVDRGMARKVAALAKATASEIGISDEQLAKWIPEIIRSASTRGYMRGPGMYLHTVPEEIRESEELMKTEPPATERAQLPIRPDTSKPTCAECHGTGIVPNKAKAGLAEWPQTLSDQIRAVQAGECRYCFCHCGRTASQIHGAAA